MASMAYSTWKSRPSGEKVFTPRSYSVLHTPRKPKEDQQPAAAAAAEHRGRSNRRREVERNRDSRRRMKPVTS
jgi:hypothetical protein